jgi:hypothetical protein
MDSGKRCSNNSGIDFLKAIRRACNMAAMNPSMTRCCQAASSLPKIPTKSR